MTTCTNNTAIHRAALPARHSIVSRLGFALAARRQRNALKNLDDRALSDLGLSRDQAEAEASKPIWDVPASWRR